MRNLTKNMPRVLFLGDIVGRPGREAVIAHIESIREEGHIDIVVVNGENAAGGSGLTRTIAESLRNAGVDGITLGDHCWDQRGFEKDIRELPYVCRPFNLYPGNPGAASLVIEKGGFRLGVLTLLGQEMTKIRAEAGFPRIGSEIEALRENCDAILVEHHAETTSEKVALGWYLDGRVAAVVGTHTHIPTADARRLPRGTGYITDVGMCGPYDSVIGREIGPVLGRFLDGLPRKFTIAEENVWLRGAIFDVDPGMRGCQSFAPFAKQISECT
jgi:hypothetical protein